MVDVLSNQLENQNRVFQDDTMADDWVVELPASEEPEEDIEDGELPEEGEITDDDEVPVPLNKLDPKLPDKEEEGRRAKRNSHSSNSSTRASKPSKYKDHDPKQTKSSKEGEMMESWINGAHRSAHHDDDRRGRRDQNGDVDLRDNDFDRRIRRRSPSPYDGQISPKRSRQDSPPPGPQRPRRGPVKTEWTERTICKFFREGFCRDGDNCVYSHNAADSRRIPELCRYYQHGYCKKNVRCLNLHGEFPCRQFHTDGCDNDECRFSHQPLNDYTQPIFDQMMKDAALAEKISKQARPQRRVLLPDGPEEFDEIYDPDLHNVSMTVIPPPSVIVPVATNAQPAAHQPTYGFFNAVPTTSNTSPHQKPFVHAPPPVMPARRSPQLPTPPPRDESSAPLSINDLLGQLSKPAEPIEITQDLMNENIRSLKHMFDMPDDDESPASPPPGEIVAGDEAPVIPIQRPYVAIPIRINDNQLDLNLIQDLTSGIHKSDPRLKRMAEKQFDLVSRSLQLGGMLDAKPKDPRSQDPRSRDPRIRSADVTASPTTLQSSHQTIPTLANLNVTLSGGPNSTNPEYMGQYGQRGLPSLSSTLNPVPLGQNASQHSGNEYEQDFEQKVSQQIRMANQIAQQQKDMDMRDYNTSPRYGSPRYDDNSYDYRKRRPRQDREPRRDERKRPFDDRSYGRSEEKEQNPSQPMTLREKRKDNVFESPLAKSTRF
ncbi:unnamed protein product [Bursaphelenchus okinawaensis]|uniref:C3H1-type domain-containing protein n=1 Tax=Bursaphelenchus okinawaensis TaxID=465554 RepID=A0A811L1Q6_9BILA|nr:unnamed protein product [Bursaphelenchus okinawaensis]CAG9114618.1 unnamed protein product [Bursaphelenchus okinawaensis]